MTRVTCARGAVATAVVLVAGAAGYFGYFALRRGAPPAGPLDPAKPPQAAPAPTEVQPRAGIPPTAEITQGFLYGRIFTVDGATYEGRLRWGGVEEAFWGDSFNGVKVGNPWLAQVPSERRPKDSDPIAIFGIELARRERPSAVRRPFLARFGEIARIEAHADEVRVTLKGGAAFDLARFDASDFDDGVRVWDGRRGVVDLDSLRIRAIDLLPTPALDAVPSRLHGTVRTDQGEFTGFVGWNREDCVGSDELAGRAAEGRLSLRFDTIRSIARRAPDSSLVTRLDGRELVLSDSADVGPGNRGLYVDDRRYGRVLISWGAFDRVDFGAPGGIGSGPAYGDFPPGSPLAGRVLTRDGRELAGRIVFDLDESASTDTLDASSGGVDYSIPLGRIAAIAPPAPLAATATAAPRGRDEHPGLGVRITLQDGGELTLERAGDLGEGNAGLLIFIDDGERPEYVPWPDVEWVAFDRPPTIDPPRGGL